MANSVKTTVLGLDKPIVGNSRSVWGGLLNNNFDTLDHLVSLNRRNTYSWVMPSWPGAATPLFLGSLGFEQLILPGVAFSGGVPVPVPTTGVSRLAVQLLLGPVFSGTIEISGDSRHQATGEILVGDSEVMTCDASGYFLSGKSWVGAVTMTPDGLDVGSADIFAVSLFDNFKQPFILEKITFLATSLAAGNSAVASLRIWRRSSSGLGYEIEEPLSGELNIAATPASLATWDLSLEPGLAAIRSDRGEGLTLSFTITGVAAESWRDIRLDMGYLIQPNS